MTVAVRAVELRRVALPLRTPFRTAGGERTEREVLLVRARTDGPDGWGECAAPEAPTYTSEWTEGAEAVLAAHLVPRLFAGRDLDGVRGHRMAKAALRTALLDAELRAAGRSLGAHLGAARTEVEAGATVGIAASLDALLDEVGARAAEGYRRVKLKVEPGWDEAPVAAVRERFGDGLALSADANGAYALSDADRLARLDAFGLVLLEQPLPADALLESAELARRLATPLCLDESVTSARTAADALALGAGSVVNVKAARVGGLDEAARIAALCREAGADALCGGMLETGLGRAAALAVAALPGCTLPADLSASDRYWGRDLTDPFVLVDGRLAVPNGPGIGVEPHPEVLEACTTSVRELTPG